MGSRVGDESIALRDAEDAWEEIYDEPLQTYMGGVRNYHYKYAGHVGLGRPLFAWLKQDQARLSLPGCVKRTETQEIPPEYHFDSPSPGIAKLQDSNTTRFLKILPGLKATVECRLHAAQLRDVVDHFEALSYASPIPLNYRGEPADLPTEPIIVDGTEIDCRQDLVQFLRKLRLPGRPRLVWCPHLCINLSSIEERNEHTGMAAHIYGSASRVLVWLGEMSLTEDYGKALASICHVVNVWMKERGIHDAGVADYFFNPEVSPFGGSLPVKPTCSTLETAWSTVILFFHHHWFSAMWSLLEVTAAKNITVIQGEGEIQWDWVGISACILQENYARLQGFWHPSWRKGTQPVVPHQILHAALSYRLSRSQSYWPRAKILLHQLLPLAEPFHCRSEQDRVFALLGVVFESDQPSREILIDYHRSADQVRQDMARVLLTSGCPELLARIQHNHPYQHFKSGSYTLDSLPLDGPSWSMQGATCLRETILPIERHSEFSACGDLQNPDMVMDDRGLKVSAVLIDHVSTWSQLNRIQFWWRSTAHTPKAASEGAPPRAPAAFSTLMTQYEFDVLKDDISPGISEDDLQRMALTLTCGKDWYGCPISDLENHVADFARCLLRGGMRWSLRCIATARVRSSGPSLTVDDLLRISEGGHSDRFLDAAASVGYARSFFETEKGLIGMGPDLMVKGDQIYIIPGVGVPLTVRPIAGGCYQLIGECYVHNLMHGEAIDSLRSGVDGLESSVIRLI